MSALHDNPVEPLSAGVSRPPRSKADGAADVVPMTVPAHRCPNNRIAPRTPNPCTW